MKLTYDDKVQIYELRKQGYSIEKLSNKFGINNSNIRYMIKLIDRYGIEFVKKVKRTPIEGGKRERRKTEIVQELITEFSLDILLKAIKLARSTYYYHLKQLDKPDKDQELKAKIQSIFIEHKGNYGYRRIHLELRNRGYLVNHKRVQRLMKVLNLQAKMRQKRKYSSHKGDVGKKADNLIQRQFEAAKPMEKCYTDVTEFAILASTQKLYLSPVLDGFNSEIIAFNLSCSPNLEQVQTMLEQAIVDYINYYNNKRIKVKLKGLSPVQYRTKSFE
ncbi:IS3 family transposase [Streptococcus chosunense]